MTAVSGLRPDNKEAWWNGCREAGKEQDRTGPNFNRCVIVHTTENALGVAAKHVADWQNRMKGKYSGYHYLVDVKGFYLFADPDKVRAYHAGKSEVWGGGGTAGASNQIGMSLVAFASHWKTELQAHPDEVVAIIHNAARCAAYISENHDIPLGRINRGQYKTGREGFLGHEDVAIPPGRKSDPGAKSGFPWRTFMAGAQNLLKVKTIVPKTPSERPPPGKPVSYSKAAAETAKTAESGDWPISRDNAEFLNDLAERSQQGGVHIASLSYLTAFIRELRDRLGLPASVSAADLAAHLADAGAGSGPVDSGGRKENR